MILVLDSGTFSRGPDSLWISKRSLVTSSSNSLSTLECHSTGPGETFILSKSSLTVFSQNLGSKSFMPWFISHIQMVLFDGQVSISFCLTFFMVRLMLNINTLLPYP